MQQITNTILMIRPVNFRMNRQTTVNNYYQKELEGLSQEEIQQRALFEFDTLVEKLKTAGVHVIVVEDTLVPDTPDSIFPNNWISFHQNGNVAIYPMFAENRRLERRDDILDIIEENGFEIKNIIDYTSAEDENVFLEGTGSLVLDRVNRKAYCALSPRADEDLFIEFCEDFEYTPVMFHAFQTVDNERRLIYHTNVMMALTEKSAMICLDALDDKKERKNIINHLRSDGKDIITITEEQINQFAGNMLQVIGKDGNRFMIMSESAYKSLSTEQIKKIEEESVILKSNISTIETLGGGGVRCMMGEVFLLGI
ncbi:MAG: arginine deiminase-related protein [Bacteroidota bacterium]